jgi:hypothetical protein
MKKSLVFLLVLALFLFACRSAAPQVQETSTADTTYSIPTATSTHTPIPPTETATPTIEPSATPTATELPPQDCEPDNVPAGLNPLTCLPPEESSYLERRPVAVKIQTFPRQQRPDYAVSLADIVYDYYQNNGLTRLYAIFYGNNPDKVGPVRSARLFDSHLTRMYETIYAFGGGDQRILNRLFSSEYADRLVVEGNNSCPAMCREDPNGFNFLIANPKEIGPYVEGKGGDNSRQLLEGMTFKHQLQDGSLPQGENIYVRYSISAYIHWEYDPQSGKYLRFQDTVEAYTAEEEQYEPVVDRLDDSQVAADNVVVLKVIHEYIYKSGNSEIVDILLGGSGEAYAFRDGKTYQLQWNRPTPEMLTLTFLDGTPYAFKPGTTWFQVVGQSSTNQLTTDNGLRFEFRLP